MIVFFNISPGARFGRIEKESSDGKVLVSMTVDEARACWEKVGTIKDCNMAFRRLAVDFDFDVEACLNRYREQEKTNVA